jgi:hypothetical protein
MKSIVDLLSIYIILKNWINKKRPLRSFYFSKIFVLTLIIYQFLVFVFHSNEMS